MLRVVVIMGAFLVTGLGVQVGTAASDPHGFVPFHMTRSRPRSPTCSARTTAGRVRLLPICAARFRVTWLSR